MQLYAHQKEIGREVHEVKRLTDALGSHVKRWSAAADSLDKALRDFGDVENFTAVLEQDFHSLTEMLVQLASKAEPSELQPVQQTPAAS